ncbi:MAG TPA: dUTP diphosphatase [Porphyromonadaceae bacterium]|nr:dUTP diphosphatase [Porphyromonadaceae bacterium]
MRIKIKKLNERAIMPEKKTQYAAAYDLAVPRDFIIRPGRQVVPLGLAIELPYGYEAKIEPRSGYSSKGFAGYRADTQQCFDADVIIGKIDADYRGGIGVIVISREPLMFTIRSGQRIAQLTIYRCEDAEFEEVDDLEMTNRGEGGFGHTGA